MNQQLSEFLDQYEGENPNTISKFRKYRNAYLGILGLTIVLSIIFFVLHEIVGFRVAELPYSQAILYLLPILSLLACLIIYLGFRDIDMTQKRLIIYEIVQVIECYNNDDFDGVFEHMEILEEEISRSSDEFFSRNKQRKFSEYYMDINKSDNKEGMINESLVRTMTILINDINNETEFKEITSGLQKGSGDEFQRNVFIDAIKRFDIGLWKSLTLFVVVASLLIYNFIGQQTGFYFAVITLTVMQIWRGGSD